MEPNTCFKCLQSFQTMDIMLDLTGDMTKLRHYVACPIDLLKWKEENANLAASVADKTQS